MADIQVRTSSIPPSTQTFHSLARSLAKELYTWLRTSNSSFAPESDQNHITVVCISDTHNTQPRIPEGDILLHAGDLSQHGTFEEVQAQLDWLNAQPHAHKIVIGGNHDLILDRTLLESHPDLGVPGKSRKDLRWGSLTYLENSSCAIVCGGRKLKVYGNPFVRECGDYAFQYQNDEDAWKGTVEADVDILLTHMPPATHFDDGKGCQFLLREMWRIQPRLAVFGHIHGMSGQEVVEFDEVQRSYESVLTGSNVWISSCKLVLLVLYQATMSLVLGREKQKATEPSIFVNATCAPITQSLGGTPPTVIYLPAS